MQTEFRTFLMGLLLVPALALTTAAGVGAEEIKRTFGQPITVYKSATCGCCQGWVDYLKTQGFRVDSHDVEDLNAVRAKLGMTEPSLMSCHTAVVDDYIVEGHVPADDIWRLLSERPDVAGITAPGMPSMSPGMNSIEPQGYDVLTFDAEGATGIFSRY